jgi:hypothetical protein
MKEKEKQKDNDGLVINPGDIIRHNFGIPPTNVDLFVFGDHNDEFLNLIDAEGTISTLTEYMANNSIKVLK